MRYATTDRSAPALFLPIRGWYIFHIFTDMLIPVKHNKRNVLLCLFYLALSGLVFQSCMTVSYVGDQYAPTSEVDVFYAERDVSREHRVIGHLSEMVRGLNADQHTRDQLIKKAMEVGADAIIITGFEHAGEKDVKRYQKAEAVKYLD